MPAVKISVRLEIDENISFMNGPYLKYSILWMLKRDAHTFFSIDLNPVINLLVVNLRKQIMIADLFAVIGVAFGGLIIRKSG